MSDQGPAVSIRRLTADDAAAVVDCFRRVYGDSYANELFYDASGLAVAMTQGRVGSVGAVDEAGMVLGHMAMSVHPDADLVELGNTVVDPAARGGGLAWQVGAELSAWCRELGYQGFLHYPTTDHHIMQRQSVKAGFETGLMLGYIPAETHGKVGATATRQRQAATIVYEPYGQGASFEGFLPAQYADLIRELAADTGLPRSWQPADPSILPRSAGRTLTQALQKRGLQRLEVVEIGSSLNESLAALAASQAPCLQIDFRLADPSVGAGVSLARSEGFRFCGWLPGFRTGDVLRLQRLIEPETDLTPALENPVARKLLAFYAADV